MILTKRMIRDKLVFKGPMTFSELAKTLQLDDIDRSKALILLNDLVDAKEANLDIDRGLWSSSVVLE
jgi:hypothetical protein